MRSRRLIAGIAAGVALACSAAGPAQSVAPAAPVPRFDDITASTGIHFTHLSSPQARFIVESMSGGVAILDFDNDGWPDIFFTNAPSVAMAAHGEQAHSALYRNNHDGTFTDVSEHAGVATPCWAMGAAVGDINNDGWPDLAVSCFDGVRLYRNNRNGTFTDVTQSSGLAKDTGWATGLTFGDYDNDGLVDLFVPHYVNLDLGHLPVFGSQKTCTYHDIPVQCGPRGLKGSPDTLWHNNGDGTFSEVSHAAGVDDPQHFFGLQAVWSDLDGDGKIDLFVANDGEPNFLYHNEGNGHFREVAANAGTALSDDGNEQANMGIALGDYDRSGRQSLAISHFSEDYGILYRNDGDLSFTDIAHTAGIALPTLPYVGWGDAFLDAGNRGLLDLILVNGHVYPQVDAGHLGTTFREPKLLFFNNGDGTFRNASALAGPALQERQVSRGLAVADLFNTGALNMVIENLTGGPMILQTRPAPGNHWLSLQLEGTTSNRLALNARVRVRSGGASQLQEVLSGSSYLSQSDLRLHFGLAGATRADEMTVLWPDGKKQTFPNVPADTFYHLREGDTLQPLHPHT